MAGHHEFDRVYCRSVEQKVAIFGLNQMKRKEVFLVVLRIIDVEHVYVHVKGFIWFSQILDMQILALELNKGQVVFGRFVASRPQ